MKLEAIYGLVLVIDPDNPGAEIPDAGDKSASTGSCVAIPVRPYVDGPVTLWLGPSTAVGDGVEVFSGTVDTPSGRLAIQVPEDEQSLLVIDVPAPSVKIAVIVDDPSDAGRVWIALKPT